MEIVLLATHNLQLLSDSGGICAVPKKSSDNSEKWNELQPTYVRHGSVNNYKRCRLRACFFFKNDGNILSLESEAKSANGGNTPMILLLPLGRDPVGNSAVITFKMAAQGPLLSRSHCVLQLSSSRLLRISHDPHEWCAMSVRDCFSLNGTFVNGRRLASGACSPPVTFNPCNFRSWKEPLMTLELGAGAKLSAGESLLEKQLFLRFDVFVRFVGERKDVGLIRRCLEGSCLANLGTKDIATCFLRDGNSDCRLFSEPAAVNIRKDVLANEECVNTLQAEEVLTLLCENCSAAARRIQLLNSAKAPGSTTAVQQHIPLACSTINNSRQCLYSTILTCRRECGTNNDDAETLTWRPASPNCTSDLPLHASEHLTEVGAVKGETRGNESMAIFLTNRRFGDGLQGSLRDVLLTPHKAGSKSVFGRGKEEPGNCASSGIASNSTKAVAHSVPGPCRDGCKQNYFLREPPLDLSPVLVKKKLLAKSPLLEPPAKEDCMTNHCRLVSSFEEMQRNEGTNVMFPTRKPPEVIEATNAGLTKDKDKLAEASKAVQQQLSTIHTEMEQVLSWRSGIDSLPSSQDDRAIVLPRHGRVKEEGEGELVPYGGFITVKKSPPLCDLAAGTGQAEWQAQTAKKRGVKRKRVVDMKETMKKFVAELIAGTDGASPHE
ncbi:hypothetical protein C3747_43g163 [Trypanosoma cruzi]|uniref:FHA domain-containing protein n=2 Tax=Trypanosoma cruzi TaxID=5693 RepID=Q4DFU3_TRYCC|nr:hypothetical protein, conserved [Trypanosoma cruzi]EAN91397.1 hypothetical protein, conserved [Trypanosoma cruzi]PWV13510.1 hypothetical protein C3747_43g163 [Trypanosoma cruzi]|eukprot:XP_813248.1 hypothetical protein [Trypanosoma cruzi strain CL Brener]